jgi:hypothetical protein
MGATYRQARAARLVREGHRIIAVELADGRAMRGLDVVGEDLELRLGIDVRLVREQQAAAGGRVHMAIAAVHAIVEHAAGTIAPDTNVIPAILKPGWDPFRTH